MKRIVVLVICFFALCTVPAWALEPLVIGEATQSATVTSSIEYTFPYPGLLPESKLYGLKIIRDTIVEFLISSSVKKAEFYLLQIEKYYASSMILFARKDYKGAETLLEKADTYYPKLWQNLDEAKLQKLSLQDIVVKLDASIGKQQEVARSFEIKASKDWKEMLKKSISQKEEYKKKLSSYR